MEAISSPASTAPLSSSEKFEQCEQCGAAVASDQRYCVECGAHRRYVHDPAVRYLRSRGGRSVSIRADARPVRRGGPPSLALAVLMAVVPLAVALGVLLGRSSTSGDGKLIAALRAQRPEVVGAAALPTTAAANASSASPIPLVSTFPLQNGWSVELQTLPGSGTNSSTVSSAESAARSKGASAVGLIVQSRFKVTPTPPAGAYVIYSGAYASRAAAEKALTRLSHHFPQAKLIHVQSVIAGAPATGGGKALSTTGFGTAHQITGSKPTSSQLAAGKQVVQHIQQTQGKSYVNAQRGLPDQISIP